MDAKRKTDRGHNHVEAFALMLYACGDCRFSETYWNSRDGVTPFGRRCPVCNSYEMKHSNWHADSYAPNYVPKKGQGVWIDMPGSLRRPVATMQAQSATKLQGQNLEEIIDGIIAGFQDGQPWLIRWPV